MFLYLITYDIPCNKRRKKISDLLEGYGQRVQLSVFECCLSPAKYAELSKRLKPRLNLQQDSLRIYPLSSHTQPQIQIWGTGLPLTEPARSVII